MQVCLHKISQYVSVSWKVNWSQDHFNLNDSGGDLKILACLCVLENGFLDVIVNQYYNSYLTNTHVTMLEEEFNKKLL